MPRTPIKSKLRLERLSILAADGTADRDLLPDLEKDVLIGFLRGMLRARRFDERLLRLQRSGQVGTFAPVKGQEASQIGAVSCLQERDWMVPAFRESAASLWRGSGMEGMLLWTAGYNEGAEIPEGQRDLPIAIPVASQVPHAVGIAYAARLLETDEVVMTFFGDGATSEGDFHEALNFAGVQKLPVVFVCQNNQWAISTPVKRQTGSETLAQKAIAYGFPGIQVDGNDVLAVHVAAREAVERAREGDGPTLIECVTYRMEVHTTADDPRRYRDQEEVDAWAKRDPIERLWLFLEGRGDLDEDSFADMEEKIKGEIDAAWKSVKKRMEELDREPLVLFDHLQEERSRRLERQMQRERERLEAQEGTEP